jgi:hypothetical protein
MLRTNWSGSSDFQSTEISSNCSHIVAKEPTVIDAFLSPSIGSQWTTPESLFVHRAERRNWYEEASAHVAGAQLRADPLVEASA